MENLENEINCWLPKNFLSRRYVDNIFLLLNTLILMTFLVSHVTFYPVSILRKEN